ncbi:HTH domain-containing protein [Enterococcus casseliflavus]|nr:HTH domain-containing protein [Enterococcus casseliflavus]
MRELQTEFITNPGIKRLMRILAFIEREQSFTVVALAEQLIISQRTLIKDIQTIKAHFGESIDLRSSNSGFYFEELDRVTYQENKEKLLEQELLFEVIEQIFFGESKDIDEVAHHYSYAESTLRRFLSRIQPTLASYGLTMTFKPLAFSGEEASIRKFFYDFYYNGEQTPYTVRPPEGLHQLFIRELAEELGNYEVGTGLSTSAFYSLLYITIVRVQQGHPSTVPKWLEKIIFQEKDFQFLLRLIPSIKKDYCILLPKEEFVWLYLMLICTRTIDRLDQEKRFLVRFNQSPEVQEIEVSYFSDPRFDRWNRSVLETLLASFLVSRKLNEAICPTLNKQQKEEITLIKKNHQEAYQKNVSFLMNYQNVLSFSEIYFEDIAVSFTMITDLLVSYYQPIKSVLFLLEGEPILVQTIRLQAQRYLGNQYQLTFLPLQELTEARLKSEQTDLIVTNYRPYIFDYMLKEDYILLSTIPTQKDWNRIKFKLNPLIERFYL